MGDGEGLWGGYIGWPVLRRTPASYKVSVRSYKDKIVEWDIKLLQGRLLENV